ncbi:MFS transporter [Rhodococcus sp. USK13]|uniref:MFS transporter n=1 Tax=Rhodococcus sp. USK13 TaxID=2806442 RepID=UPI00201657FE|nr:MFS transporter [Rhodococcus sp. USK13]
MVGTTLEFYDFFIYGTAAALVFPRLFFTDSDPLIGSLLSFATFGVGFLARPLGGIVFGHFGDKIGRKKVLIISLLMMGIATICMGLLPTYESIGLLAPLLLTLLRLVQGFSVGGEWTGAVLMAIEHAGPRRRGFFGSFPTLGLPAGTLLATGAFLAVAQLDDDAFFSWGWRLPFLISIVLVVAGILLRLRISESPEFSKVKERKSVVDIPIVEVFRKHFKQIVLVAGAALGHNICVYISMSYLVSYAGNVGIDRSGALLGVMVSSMVAIFLFPIFGALSDRIGHRRTYLAGLVAMAIVIFPVFTLVNTGSTPTFVVALVLLFGVAMAPVGALSSVVLTQVFPARVRFSGTSVGYTLAAVLGGAFAPMIAAWLYASTGSSTAIAAYMTIAVLISMTAVILMPGDSWREDRPDSENFEGSASAAAARLSSG